MKKETFGAHLERLWVTKKTFFSRFENFFMKNKTFFSHFESLFMREDTFCEHLEGKGSQTYVLSHASQASSGLLTMPCCIVPPIASCLSSFA
jgi:hypothetical protein